jgi:hypothetical protein
MPFATLWLHPKGGWAHENRGQTHLPELRHSVFCALEFCPICMLCTVLDKEGEPLSGQGLVWEWNGLSIINLS